MRKRHVGIALVWLASALACTGDLHDTGLVLPHQGPPEQPAGSTVGRGTGSVDASLDSAFSVDDAEIASALLAISRGAVAESELARSRSMTFEVQDYAAQVLVSHGAALQRQEALFGRIGISPSGGSMAAAIEASTTQRLAALNGLDVDQFDAAFLSAEIALRTAALSLIDLTLRPQVRNADLGRELATVRALLVSERASAENLGGGNGSLDGGRDGGGFDSGGFDSGGVDANFDVGAGPIGP